MTSDTDNLCSWYCGVQVGICCLARAASMGWGEGSTEGTVAREGCQQGGLSLPCLSDGVSIHRNKFAEQEQYDFKTTIIYCASCHCKL